MTDGRQLSKRSSQLSTHPPPPSLPTTSAPCYIIKALRLSEDGNLSGNRASLLTSNHLLPTARPFTRHQTLLLCALHAAGHHVAKTRYETILSLRPAHTHRGLRVSLPMTFVYGGLDVKFVSGFRTRAGGRPPDVGIRHGAAYRAIREGQST